MHPLEKKTLKIIQQENLLQAGEKVVAAVSAGPDSMALLHILTRLSPVLDFTLAAAYVNHGLRPSEAENEKNLVAAEALRLGVAFFSGAVDVIGFAARQKMSIEHAARILRYDFLEKTARACSAQKIGLAHTADDQAEEILLRLIRGTARKGLSGMKTLRADKFIRPFLRFSKSMLLDYLEKYSIPYRIDSSNRENVYLRNRVRNELLPYLAADYNPDIRQTLIRTANILQDEEELLENLSTSAFTETVAVMPEDPARQIPDSNTPAAESQPLELKINLDLFLRHPRAIQRRVLEKCCWLMSCEPRSRQIENLLQLAMHDSPEGSLHLADGLRVMKNKDQLCFEYPRGLGHFRGSLEPETSVQFPETNIFGPGSYDFPVLNKRLIVEYLEDFIPGTEDSFPSGECLDSGLFSFPLTLRGPKPGDRFHPLGAPGSKKVNDFLGDQKVNLHARGLVPVLCAGDSILALLGLRTDHRYRITEKTTQALRVRWEELE